MYHFNNDDFGKDFKEKLFKMLNESVFMIGELRPNNAYFIQNLYDKIQEMEEDLDIKRMFKAMDISAQITFLGVCAIKKAHKHSEWNKFINALENSEFCKN